MKRRGELKNEYKLYNKRNCGDGGGYLSDPDASAGYFSKKNNQYRLKSFLYYIPYAVLSAMTFPAIFSSTASKASAALGCGAAILLAYYRKGLLIVAVGAAATAFVAQILGL